ncbi:CNK3/IPCEF1 fusion protein [Holothuria leucospilota]|uniref:CNK3/IPCEF1 fusion protein n=1 Tax=Holothuria leucospilota TaxID=206669 RepID=A0A9Q1BHW8_HOLLE|nr:CNK3/IPCEF1 fusion protein [Holothuria leucospilota]
MYRRKYLEATHHNLCHENLQSIALNLNVKAGDLGRYLQKFFPNNGNNKKDWLSAPVLSRISETVSAAKLLLAWLDRLPFKSDKDFQVVREDILQYALTLTQETEEHKIFETCQELQDICDNLVKKATDPLVIQTTYVEIVTLKKKKPDEELGLEIRTTAPHGTHCIIATRKDTATPSLRKVTDGDEVLQVNYQTVVGWEHKKVIQALTANPTEVVLTLKKRPRNLNQAGQLVRPSRHTFQTGGLASLPRRKHSGNTLQPPATKDDLYLKTLETQSESEKKPPPLQTQQSRSDSEPLEPENKLSKLHRCPTMGEAVLRRPAVKKSKDTSVEGRPRSLPLDTVHLNDVTSEDLRQWLEKQDKVKTSYNHSAEQLSPRETPRFKKTVRIQLDLNGNSCHDTEPEKVEPGEERFQSTAEISLEIPNKTVMAEPKKKEAEKEGAQVMIVKREENINRKTSDTKTSSGSSSEGFVYWEEEEVKPEKEEVQHKYKETNVDEPKYERSGSRVSPAYQDSAVVRRPHKDKKKKRKKLVFTRRITCVDLGPGSCEGWLFKKSESKHLISKDWILMFFKLKEFVLYYYKSKEADKAKGVICLPGYTVQESDKRKWAIKISHKNVEKKVYIAAQKESDWKRWMEHLQLASVLYTNSENVRNSQIFSDNFTGGDLPPVIEEYSGYHSESDDESVMSFSPSPVRSNQRPSSSASTTPQGPRINVIDVDEDNDDKLLQEFNAVADEVTVFQRSCYQRRSTRRKTLRNANKLYDMQTTYHPSKDINEKLITKSVLQRTIEGKRKDVEELDKLLAQKITSKSFHAWQQDHPNLLHEIARARTLSDDVRDYSSDEEGSITSSRSDKSELGATGPSPTVSRKLYDGATGPSPTVSRKSYDVRSEGSSQSDGEKKGDEHSKVKTNAERERAGSGASETSL